MGKQRRPRGPRSTWEPKPVPAEDPAAAPQPPVPASSIIQFGDGAAGPASPDEPEPRAPPAAPLAPVRQAAVPRMAFAPERIDLAGIGATIAGYVRGEGEAAAAHMRALGGARSPAELVRLQVGEIRRAAGASLTCWSQVAREAGRVFASR